MIPILSAWQIREADLFTIQHEPVSSINLMERAAQAFMDQLLQLVKTDSIFYVFCGVGNNGADGLAISRLLRNANKVVHVFCAGSSDKATREFQINLGRIEKISWIKTFNDFPEINENVVIIDAFFGSGLSRPIEGLIADLIMKINATNALVVSVDIASGLYADQPVAGNVVICPDYTISFQLPKLVFFQPDFHQYVGKWVVVPIGLHQSFINSQSTDWYCTDHEFISTLLKYRNRFSHKGDAGRVLLVAGNRGKMGAAILASKAVLRSGAGLLYTAVPNDQGHIIQIAVPEAMVLDRYFTEKDLDFSKVDAIAVGPGIGTGKEDAELLLNLIKMAVSPMVLDADALNIIAQLPAFLKDIPKGSLLTPHPGEFQRLVGNWKDDYHKLELLRGFCAKYELNVALKGAFTAVCSSEGKVYFNTTGNPGMATAGSGDVLTGMAVGLLAQGITPIHALRLSVYLHGLAGDLATNSLGENSMIASDIIENISSAFLTIQS